VLVEAVVLYILHLRALKGLVALAVEVTEEALLIQALLALEP
jgi:hypothetical protein